MCASPSAPRCATVVLVLLLLVAGCASAGGGSTPVGDVLVSYERRWPDGLVDSQTIWTDGRVEMRHGDHVERFDLRDVDLERLTAALEAPIPTGSPSDAPVRLLTLADGSTVRAPDPAPGTVTELLDRLMETHAT